MKNRPCLTGMRFVALIALLVVSSDANAAEDGDEADSVNTIETRTKVVMLGTGTPNADPERSGPSVAVVVDDTPYIIDCGPGVVRRAAAAAQNGVEALRAANLKHLFITHLHSDHTIGYPDMILTPWVLERDAPLQVYGPEGTEEMTGHLLAAYAQDIQTRLNGREPANDQGHRVDVHEIEPGVIYRDSLVTVTAFRVLHGSWPAAFGFVFQTPDRRIVISGDTAPSETVVEHATDCDILIHEVYSQAGFERRESVWQDYHKHFHTSAIALADIARRARPGLLVLYHQLYWGTSDEDLVREITSMYDGPVVSGSDLDVF